MNKRQKKKRRMKYWRLAGEPYTMRWEKGQPVFDIYQCPYCGFEIDDYNADEIKSMGGDYKTEDYHSFYDGCYSGHSWTEKITCPICHTKYEYDTSDI